MVTVLCPLFLLWHHLTLQYLSMKHLGSLVLQCCLNEQLVKHEWLCQNDIVAARCLKINKKVAVVTVVQYINVMFLEILCVCTISSNMPHSQVFYKITTTCNFYLQKPCWLTCTTDILLKVMWLLVAVITNFCTIWSTAYLWFLHLRQQTQPLTIWHHILLCLNNSLRKQCTEISKYHASCSTR